MNYDTIKEEIKNIDIKSNVNTSKKGIYEVTYTAYYKGKIKTIKRKVTVKERYIAPPVSGGKVAYLTFDDGPSNKITPQVLEILKSEDIKATFFLLGSRVELYPELVKREYEEGHFLANHGYSHTYSKIYSSPESVLEEYNKTTQAIRNAIGIPEYDSHLFRFPGGLPGGKYKEVKKQAKELLNSNNIANVDWNALTGDAEGKKTVDDQMSYAIKTIGNKNSVVILMHDAADKQITVEVLPQLIKYLKENGYRFANFSEIMK